MIQAPLLRLLSCGRASLIVTCSVLRLEEDDDDDLEEEHVTKVRGGHLTEQCSRVTASLHPAMQYRGIWEVATSNCRVCQ